MNTERIVCNSAFMALIALLAACHGKQEASADIRPVQTAVIGTGKYGGNLTYTGEIRARHESDLGFQIAGKLTARPAEVGMYVTAGTVLAQLDPADERVAVASAQSAVSAARTELARATSEEASYRHLLERGLTTRTTYIEHQTATKTAQSRLEQATGDLDLRRRQLNYTTLRADGLGVITRVSADVGTVLGRCSLADHLRTARETVRRDHIGRGLGVLRRQWDFGYHHLRLAVAGSSVLVTHPRVATSQCRRGLPLDREARYRTY
ncbi:MAG: hypothetical protein E6K52_13885 [Gammaproteobacteria bacterium]|nr:MAG: hypothetical protein E6K52_13885 [Gammaproteobacteria bacterium]